MWLRWALSLTLLWATGCGSAKGKFAPVSGKVTLNGEALANAFITFTPMGSSGTDEPPAVSSSKTNAQGEYTLEAKDGVKGALVGKHKVTISYIPDYGDARRDPKVPRPEGEQVPKKYNTESTLEIDVLPEGNAQADFKLTKP
jgi:hypothetical protein